MSHCRAYLVAVAVIAVAVSALGSCRERRAPAQRPALLDAAPLPPRPLALAAPRAVPSTAAQRAYDADHRAGLLEILADLKKLYDRSLALQAEGLRSTAAVSRWPKDREILLARAGKVRAKVLAVDPLYGRSWAAARASALLRYLTVRLPDAIRESWRSKPGGAFVTWRSDFLLIWRRLRRYVENLPEKPSRTRSKDSR